MFPRLEFDRLFWKVLFLVVLILFFGVSQVGENQDKAKIIDVKKVSSCPTTKEKWLLDATAKNCSSKIVTFRYHCLLNHWRNESFVFCGEDKRIIGSYCPEYDETRGRIRENYDMKCIESSPPCPIKYNSSDVFKYPDCIKSNTNDTSNTTTKENIEENIYYIKGELFFVLVFFIFLYSFAMYLMMKRSRYRRIRDEYTSLDDGLSDIYGDESSRRVSYSAMPYTYEDEYSWSATELSKLFGYQNPMIYIGFQIKQHSVYV